MPIGVSGPSNSEQFIVIIFTQSKISCSECVYRERTFKVVPFCCRFDNEPNAIRSAISLGSANTCCNATPERGHYYTDR
jgi:hypothetical protein